MIDDLNALLLKPVAFISSLGVAWAFSCGLYHTTQTPFEPQPISISVSEANNSVAIAKSNLPAEPSIAAVQDTVALAELTLDSSVMDSSLQLTPSPNPFANPLPSPLPSHTPVTSVSPANPPAAAVLPATNYESLFEQWSTHFGVDVNLLKHIARCESRFNPASIGGIYGGMYQFSASTWKSTRTSMEHDPDPNLRFDANEAIKTAAFKIASGGQSAWKNCLPR